MRSVNAFVIAAIVLAAVPAWAQGDEQPVNLNLGGGYTFTVKSEVRDKIGDGFHLAAGATFNIYPRLGVRAEYSYHRLRETVVKIPVSLTPTTSTTQQDFVANGHFQILNFNAVLRPANSNGGVSPYLLGGFGWYFRSVDVTSRSVGYVPGGYCEASWYVCYPSAAVPVENLVGTSSSTDIGINAGGGVVFRVGERSSVFVEARYHYIWGAEAIDSAGTSHGKANGQFLPITVGIRF